MNTIRKKTILMLLVVSFSSSIYADWRDWLGNAVNSVYTSAKNHPIITTVSCICGMGLVYTAWKHYKKSKNPIHQSSTPSIDASAAIQDPRIKAREWIDSNRPTIREWAAKNVREYPEIEACLAKINQKSEDAFGVSGIHSIKETEQVGGEKEFQWETEYPNLAQLKIGNGGEPFFSILQKDGLKIGIKDAICKLQDKVNSYQFCAKEATSQLLNEIENFFEVAFKIYNRFNHWHLRLNIASKPQNLIDSIRRDKKFPDPTPQEKEQSYLKAEKNSARVLKEAERRLEQEADCILQKGKGEILRIKNEKCDFYRPSKTDCQKGSDENGRLHLIGYVIASMIMGYKKVAYQFKKLHLSPELLALAKAHNIMFIKQRTLIFTPEGVDDALLAAKLPDVRHGDWTGAAMGYLLGYGQNTE